MSATIFYDDQAEIALLTNTFTLNGSAADPTTVSCVVTDPSGNAVTHTYNGTAPADIVKPLVGKYTLAVPCSPNIAGIDGLWSFVWIGTGAVSDVQPGTWRVLPKSIGNFYCGLEELKDRLAITDNVDDSSAQMAIQAASSWINEYCVVPETPVLTADLRWVPAGELLVSDELIGFDEHLVGHKRHYRRAVVTAVPRRMAACTRIVLDDGREVITAENHRWLARSNYGKTGPVYDWVHASDIRPGYDIASPVRVWPEGRSFDDGWMSGILDGEGWVHRARPGKGAHLGVAQNPGAVLARIERYLKEADLPYSFNSDERCQKIEIYPRWASMELMGRLQPCRLMPLSDELWDGGQLSRQGVSSARVVSVEPAGVREVVSLGTSTGTYIANGLASHNCGQHFYRVTETRTFRPHNIWEINIDPVITVTALNVDTVGNGVFDQAWVQGVDYQLIVGHNEYNPNAFGVARPYRKVQVLQAGKWFPYTWPYSHLDRVQVVGTWGWPAVPPGVTQACLVLAAQWFKEKDAPFGVAGVSDFGVVRIQANPWVVEQLRPYIYTKRKVGV
jgi:hypothetical protein